MVRVDLGRYQAVCHCGRRSSPEDEGESRVLAIIWQAHPRGWYDGSAGGQPTRWGLGGCSLGNRAAEGHLFATGDLLRGKTEEQAQAVEGLWATRAAIASMATESCITWSCRCSPLGR
jgi:hypothetical protein